LKNEERKGLMSIDHADLLMDLLCGQEEYENKKEFRDKLEKLRETDLSTKSKMDDMYLNTLTGLGVVDSISTSTGTRYKRNSTGDKICTARSDPKKIRLYHNRLRYRLLESPYTGIFFKEFVSQVNQAGELNEDITFASLQGFTEGTIRTIKSLGTEADLYIEKDCDLLIIKKETDDPPSLENCHQSILKNYNQTIQNLKQRGIFSKTKYAKISELRDNVSGDIGLTSEEFDNYFREILTSSLGKSFEIFGSAPQYLPDDKDPDYERSIFEHKGKIYVFVSISKT
jgi:hypothetical protein